MRKTIFVLPFCLLFVACEPLHYQVYLRNYSKSQIVLTLTNSSDGVVFPQEFYVHAFRQILPIGKKTRGQITDSLLLRRKDNHTLLFTVPSGTTVYLSDLFPLTEHKGNNRMVIARVGSSDTLDFNYPYRHTSLLKRMWVGYDLFYRTICRVDIKDDDLVAGKP